MPTLQHLHHQEPPLHLTPHEGLDNGADPRPQAARREGEWPQGAGKKSQRHPYAR